MGEINQIWVLTYTDSIRSTLQLKIELYRGREEEQAQQERDLPPAADQKYPVQNNSALHYVIHFNSKTDALDHVRELGRLRRQSVTEPIAAQNDEYREYYIMWLRSDIR